MARGALIVGASLSGLRLAEQLRALGYTGPMTVAGAEAHMPYNRPPLSKDVLFEDASADPLTRLTFNIRPSLSDVTWQLGSPAEASDLQRRVVTLANGRDLNYDVLGIATGLTPRRLPLSGGEENRHVVRTIEDAVRLKAALLPGARVVVAGGGFIGCEVAASAVKRGCIVTIVEPLPLPMGRAIGQDLASAIKAFHEAHGVTFRLNTTITGLVCDPTKSMHLQAVTLSDGGELHADVLIEAVGSVCNTGWLAGNGLDLSDGLLTDNALRVEGRADVAAAGDVARFPNPRYGHTPRRVEHWAIPALTAKRAAQSLAEKLLGREPATKAFDPIPTFWSDQFGMRIQSIGMPGLADRTQLIEGELTSLGQPDKGLAMGYWLGDALIGAIAIGMPSAKLSEYRTMLTTQG